MVEVVDKDLMYVGVDEYNEFVADAVADDDDDEKEKVVVLVEG